MTRVRTSDGPGIMCPGCWCVVVGVDVGLPGASAEDLAFVASWVPDPRVHVHDEGIADAWLCPECGRKEEL